MRTPRAWKDAIDLFAAKSVFEIKAWYLRWKEVVSWFGATFFFIHFFLSYAMQVYVHKTFLVKGTGQIEVNAYAPSVFKFPR